MTHGISIYPFKPFIDLADKRLQDRFQEAKEITLDDLNQTLARVHNPPPKISGSDIEERILSIFLDPNYLYGSKDYISSCKDVWIEKFHRFTDKRKPLKFVIMACPFKVPVPLKTLRVTVDMAEMLLIIRLRNIAKWIETIYEPGAVISILAEGILGEGFGIPLEDGITVAEVETFGLVTVAFYATTEDSITASDTVSTDLQVLTQDWTVELDDPITVGDTVSTDLEFQTYAFLWNGEHASGDAWASRFYGTASLQGTLIGAEFSSAQNHTPQGQDSLYVNADDERLQFDVFNNTNVSGSEGYIDLWVYYERSVSAGWTTIWETWHDSQNLLRLGVRNSDDKCEFYQQHDSNYEYIITDDAFNNNAWNRFEGRWSVSQNTLEARINGGSWTTLGSPSLAHMSGPLDEMALGVYLGVYNGASYYIDDLRIWTTFDQSRCWNIYPADSVTVGDSVATELDTGVTPWTAELEDAVTVGELFSYFAEYSLPIEEGITVGEDDVENLVTIAYYVSDSDAVTTASDTVTNDLVTVAFYVNESDSVTTADTVTPDLVTPSSIFF